MSSDDAQRSVLANFFERRHGDAMWRALLAKIPNGERLDQDGFKQVFLAGLNMGFASGLAIADDTTELMKQDEGTTP